MTDVIDVVIDDLVDIEITIVNDIPITITVEPLEETQVLISDAQSGMVVEVLQEIVNVEVQPEIDTTVIEITAPGSGGGGGGSSLTFLERKLDSISALTTKVIDVVPLIDFKLIEYTFRASNSPNDKTKGLKMIVRKTDSSVNDEVFARIGDAISFNIGAEINGSDMNLILQNNENFALDLALIRASL